jgi:uncharacterized RDD family membrane protein YckC
MIGPMATVVDRSPVLSERAIQARSVRGPRARALFYDVIGLGVVSIVVNNVYGVAQSSPGPPFSIAGFALLTTNTYVPWPWLALVGVAYFAVPEALVGGSIGKLIVGLRVVRVDAKPLGLSDVLLRNLVRLVDYQPFLYLVGGFFVLMTQNSQRLGDIAAGTTVVAEAHAREPEATRTSSRRTIRFAEALLVLAVVETIAFNYFGRPALVVAGMVNTQGFPMGAVSSYSVGRPQWSLGRIIYPVTTRGGPNAGGGTNNCTGTLELDLTPFGWTSYGAADFNCEP